MEFPALFEDLPALETTQTAIEESPAVETTPAEAPPATEPEPPKTAIALISGPITPVMEIIRDASVLRNALDKQLRHPIPLLGEELLSEGYITSEQLEKAILAQKASGRKRIGEILVSAGVVNQDTIGFVLAKRLGVPSVDLRKLEIDHDALSLVPKLFAGKHGLMPCLIHHNHLVVAMENPMDQTLLKALRFAYGKHVLAVMAPRGDIEWAIEHRYKELLTARNPFANHWI